MLVTLAANRINDQHRADNNPSRMVGDAWFVCQEFSDSEDVVVRVDFSLPEAEPRREYWRFEHSVIGGWRYRRPTTIVAYYLNMI